MKAVGEASGLGETGGRSPWSSRRAGLGEDFRALLGP